MCNWFQNKSPTHTFAVDWDTGHGNWAAPCYFNGASPTDSPRWCNCLLRHLAYEGLYVSCWPPPCPISCSGIRTPIGRTVWVTRKRRSIYYVRISFSIRHIDSCLLVVQHIIITCVYECSATLPPHFLIPVYEYKAILDFSTQYICIYQQHNIWIKLMDINQIQVNWKSKFYFGIFKRIYEIIRTKLIIFFRVVID